MAVKTQKLGGGLRSCPVQMVVGSQKTRLSQKKKRMRGKMVANK